MHTYLSLRRGGEQMLVAYVVGPHFPLQQKSLILDAVVVSSGVVAVVVTRLVQLGKLLIVVHYGIVAFGLMMVQVMAGQVDFGLHYPVLFVSVALLGALQLY